MTLYRNTRTAVSALVILLILFEVTSDCSHAQQPRSSAHSRLIDSIPSTLFKKMFQNHQLVGSPGLTWKKQRVVTVAFDGGSDELYQLIEMTANEWTALGGQLSFSFKDETGQYRHWTSNDKSAAANIRIGFANTGYWSLLGVLAKNVDPGDPTMNFGGFTTDLRKYFNGQNQDQWRTSYEHTTILHEFGHAIGLSHEHFNQECQKDLKIDTILAYLTGPPNNWSTEQARFNIDAQYYSMVLAQQSGPLESKLLSSPTTDQASVMLYVFPISYYKTGGASVCKPIGDHGEDWPTKLSNGDKQFYLASYRTIPSPFGAASPKKGK